VLPVASASRATSATREKMVFSQIPDCQEPSENRENAEYRVKYFYSLPTVTRICFFQAFPVPPARLVSPEIPAKGAGVPRVVLDHPGLRDSSDHWDRPDSQHRPDSPVNRDQSVPAGLPGHSEFRVQLDT
jgi:hypothetical protein